MRLDVRAVGKARLVAALLPTTQIGIGNVGVYEHRWRFKRLQRSLERLQP
jgi:hypothetical protein